MWAEMNVDIASSSVSSSSSCSTCPSPLPLDVVSPEPELPELIQASESSSSFFSNSNSTLTSTNRDHGSPSSRSTSSPRRVGRVGAAPLVPNKPELQPEIDPRHLVPLHTLATIATCSPDSLQRLTTSQNKKKKESEDESNDNKVRHSSVTDHHDKDRDNDEEEEGEEGDDDDDDKASEGGEENDEGYDSGIRYSPQPEHHARSPRSYTIHQAYLDAKKQPQKGQREAMPRTSRATHHNHHREVVSPTRRRKPSPASPPSPGPRSRSRALSLSLSQSHSQLQSQTPSQSSQSQASINTVLLSHKPKLSSSSSASPSTTTTQNRPQQDIIIRYPQGKSSRRPALDISSERLLSSLRNQLKTGEFPPYTMPHPKRDGAVSGKKWRCTYELEDGDRCNAACSRKGEARRHAFTHEIHLRWICPSLTSKTSSCGKLFARQDAAIRHVEQSRSCKDLAANRTEGFPVLVWEEEDEIVAKIVTLVWNEDEVEGEEWCSNIWSQNLILHSVDLFD
ncbi:hypothetical protein Clacol_004718 [Clathrus columnatus]|uniref:C2H2-type domain-containing protein n=1 Tax=Clathrus columnatus TaxID=1419009 RepID=A0AAV5A9V6_9AGAM|nr:hypothetical protein Clacol_004718 [Clathrus columnatus]